MPFCACLHLLAFTMLHQAHILRSLFHSCDFWFQGLFHIRFLLCYCLTYCLLLGETLCFSTPQFPLGRDVHEYSIAGFCLVPHSRLVLAHASLEEREITSLVGKCNGQYYVSTWRSRAIGAQTFGQTLSWASGRVFLGETNVWVSRLSKLDCPS